VLLLLWWLLKQVHADQDNNFEQRPSVVYHSTLEGRVCRCTAICVTWSPLHIAWVCTHIYLMYLLTQAHLLLINAMQLSRDNCQTNFFRAARRLQDDCVLCTGCNSRLIAPFRKNTLRAGRKYFTLAFHTQVLWRIYAAIARSILEEICQGIKLLVKHRVSRFLYTLLWDGLSFVNE
jgi:hypothetical protein